MSFDAIGIDQDLLKGVKACGYKNLTPIQQKAMPIIRQGKDVLASAQTGTGKTAAFAIPLLDKLLSKKSQGRAGSPAVIILTPTRELAIQVNNNVAQYSQFTQLKSGAIYGGANIGGQSRMLKQGLDILVATPGRLIEHLQLQNLNVSQVKHVVLDEADRMLDMGFVNDIEHLLASIKHHYQTLLFSATFSNKVKTLAKRYLANAQHIEVAKQNTTSGKVKQKVYRVSEARKRELLSELVGVNNWQQVLVFAGTKESANQLAQELKLDGLKTAVCHGDKGQGARNKALDDFVQGRVRLLVATDVAARGLDIDNLPYVINYHLPFLAEDYIHRIGRTGRAGKSGLAISLVSPKDEKFLDNIEQLIGRKFESIVMPGYEFDASAEPKAVIGLNKPSSKNRYQAGLDKNQSIARKQAFKAAKDKWAKGKAKKGKQS
jgi:superfamily II DNA/RNA helicase